MTLQNIYLVCGLFGFLWIVGTAVLGFVESGDTAGDGGGDAGGDLGSADAGSDFGSADTGGKADVSGDLGNLEVQAVGSFKAGMLIKRHRISPVMLILKLLSPSTITSFLFFFGVAGYIVLQFFPVFGTVSVIPAIIAGLIGYNAWSAMTSAIIRRMHVSNSYSNEEMIGRVAEVTVTIGGGKMGEVTYAAKGVRETAPAKAADPTITLKPGTKVMLSDEKDGVFLVEPWTHGD